MGTETKRARRAAILVIHLWAHGDPIIPWLLTGDEHYYGPAAESMVLIRPPGRPSAAKSLSHEWARRAATCALAAETETQAIEWTLAAEHAAAAALECSAREETGMSIDP